MVTRLREDSHLPAEGWTNWIWAMAPENTTRVKNLARRGEDQEGYKNAKIVNELCGEHGDADRLCGIYEWRATRPFGSDPTVVYVGSTCARNGGSCTKMKNRIVSYCTHGNHKTTLINEALQKGYELWVRFKPAVDEQEARDMENALLDTYNYAWNIRQNAKRNILP